MDSFFEDKSAKVLVVEGSSATRTLMTEVIRKLGFSDVTGVNGIKAALEFMEAEPVNWVFAPLMADQPENALHILQIITKFPSLKDVRLSLVLDDEEKHVLPKAFENGLLSVHPKPFTKDSLAEELEGLLKIYEENKFESTLVAGHYIRKSLVELELDEDLLNFEKSMIDRYPKDRDLLFNLVPPLCRLEKTEEAKSVLRQIKLFDDSVGDKIKEYCDEYLDGADIDEAAEGEKFNLLGLETVAIVDSDDSIHKNLTEILEEIGVPNIQCFSDGEAAAEAVKSADPPIGLIIMEWRIPKMPGPLFLQRVKSEGGETTPVVVLSSLLGNDDVPLVREMGVANVTTKPFQRKDLLQNLVWTVQQDRAPTDQGTMERKMREFLRSSKLDEAMALKSKFMMDDEINDGAKETIEAEFAFYQKNYESARDHGIEAIKLNGDSLFVLNLLGKALMNLRDFEVALRCFEKAQAMSPMNIERLCQIAEVHSEMGNEEAAQESLDAANAIDGQARTVAETEAKVAVNLGDTETAKQLMGQLEAIENVVAFMNNSAVAMARCEMIAEGMEQYRKTLASIPDDRPDTKAIVEYNLALAHARADELDEAKAHLESCANTDSRVRGKAKSLLNRINKAVEKGTALNLNLTSNKLGSLPTNGSPPQAGAQPKAGDGEGSATETEAVADNLNVAALMALSAGDLCLYLIYNAITENDEVKKLWENCPRFNIRTAIERGESGGADKMMSESA